jgi:hypothetical protein
MGNKQQKEQLQVITEYLFVSQNFIFVIKTVTS